MNLQKLCLTDIAVCLKQNHFNVTPFVDNQGFTCNRDQESYTVWFSADHFTALNHTNEFLFDSIELGMQQGTDACGYHVLHYILFNEIKRTPEVLHDLEISIGQPEELLNSSFYSECCGTYGNQGCNCFWKRSCAVGFYEGKLTVFGANGPKFTLN